MFLRSPEVPDWWQNLHPPKKSLCAGHCLFDRLVTVSRHLPWRPGCPFTHGFPTLVAREFLSTWRPGQKLSLSFLVYILLKNYPWHPGSTYYSTTIPAIQGLQNMKGTWNKHENQHVNQQDIVILCFGAVARFIDILFAISFHKNKIKIFNPRVYILKNYRWHPGSTYYSKTIPAIQGLHTTQNLSLAFRVYITWNMKKSTGQRSRALFYFALML